MRKEAKTYWAKIFLGLKHGYSDTSTPPEDVVSLCRKYCDANGLCVTITPTNFIYSHGYEEGLIIGLINYPRFPQAIPVIKEHAFNIALLAKNLCRQKRVSVMFPSSTVMIGGEND